MSGFTDLAIQATVGTLFVAASLFFIQQEPLVAFLLLAAGADNIYDAYRIHSGTKPPSWYWIPNVALSLISVAASCAAMLYVLRFATYYTFPGFLALAVLLGADIGLAVREVASLGAFSAARASEWLE